MSIFSCCCCREKSSEEERHSFAKPINTQKTVKELNIGEQLLVRNVNVPDIDQQFKDVAALYNEEVEHCGTIADCITRLADISHCEPSLTTCIRTLKEKHDECDIKVNIDGYNFSLIVNAKDVPEDLQQAQELLQKLSHAAKAINKSQIRLGEMVNTVLQNKTQMADKVKELNPAHLDQIRLGDNLDANVRNVDKAKQLSREYEEEANRVFREIANIVEAQI
ncbi:uncharacterized protein O3C94_012546 [Discoglossus pictus]